MARKKDAAAEGGMTMEQAVEADAERQAEDAEMQQEAEDDAKFKRHLLRIGGQEMVKAVTEATLELLDQLQRRAKQKSWRSMGEAVQRDIISRSEWAAKQMVAAAVSNVAGNTFPALPGFLKGVAIGDKGYKLVLETHVSDDRHRLALLSSITKRVLVVLADPDIYAQHDPIQPLKDQPDLIPDLPESATSPQSEAEAGPSDGGEGAEAGEGASGYAPAKTMH